MKDILLMTNKLKTDLSQMLKEHEEIVAALEKLVAEARKERKLEYARFTDRLTWHAQTEEEVYYPAAILIDEYLKLKLARANAEMSRNPPSTKKTRTQKGKRKQ
jgi:hemerythrin superfamily protein